MRYRHANAAGSGRVPSWNDRVKHGMAHVNAGNGKPLTDHEKMRKGCTPAKLSLYTSRGRRSKEKSLSCYTPETLENTLFSKDILKCRCGRWSF
jgi:hypothetical protein